MGAEWPAGAALAMESWPPRSRGFMSGILQGSWGLGFALSALAYGFLFDLIGWRPIPSDRRACGRGSKPKLPPAADAAEAWRT
jgi:MFS family permease